jgi:hypothetical protein
MKKIFPFLIVLVLTLSVIGIARTNTVWASPQPPSGELGSFKLPSYVIKTITENGVYNIGGVCTIEVVFNKPGVWVIADAEIPLKESQKVPFYRLHPQENEEILLPGCHFVHYKLDENNQEKIVDSMDPLDGNAEVCFGAHPVLPMEVYNYLDKEKTAGSAVWRSLSWVLKDINRLICSPAMSTGVYAPSVWIKPPEGVAPGSWEYLFFPPGGSVIPPPSKITIYNSGTYPVGGICLIKTEYYISNLMDTVEVQYPEEDTLKVPTDNVDGIIHYPGCHVLHFKDLKIKDVMTRQEGKWQICFAAIPEKIMTIYYYMDNDTNITPPWMPLVSTTENGMVCADLVDWSAVYTPVAK